MRRRVALQSLGGAAAASLWTPGSGAALAPLADRIAAAPREQAMVVAASAITAGASAQDVLAASFLAGVRGIRPRPHGILHSVMMVDSCLVLAADAPRDEALLLALWNVDDTARSLEASRSEGALPPRPRPSALHGEAALRELVAAMEAWDAERADSALLAALASPGLDVFEALWPLAARCASFIGHKPILAAQITRALRRLPAGHAEPALRSLLHALLVGRETADWEAAGALTDALPAGWERGREDPAESLSLFRDLRRASAADSQRRVVAALRAGLGPASIWDALRLWGAELFVQRPGRTSQAGRGALLPVHGVTAVHALAYAFREAQVETTRRRLLLQAAALVARIRDALVELVSLPLSAPGLEAGLALPPPLAEDEPARLRTGLVRKAREHHQHKYAAAAIEESRRAHPRWAAVLLAPAAEYVAAPADPESETHARARRLLASG